MRKILLLAAALSLALPLAFGSGSPAGAKGLKITNRLAPVGVVGLQESAARARVPKSLPKFTHLKPLGTTVGGCSDSSATNVRANTDCTNQDSLAYVGRGAAQNETGVAVNPTNPRNVLISQNDYRLGDGKCGVDWSTDGGKSFGSVLAPIGFGNAILDNGGARHYWTTGGDTSVGFDSTGEAYLMCQVFDRPFATDERGESGGNGVADASGFMLFRSADGGASWNFTGSYVATSTGVEGGDTTGLLDKEYMTIDNNPDSPWADRIYVVWAQYPTDFSNSPTYFAYSDDYGNSWSTPIEISGKSQDLCPITFSTRTDFSCDESQFNAPFVGPDGAVYDTFVNFNNCAGALRGIGFDCPDGPDTDNHNQILLVKSTDGGATWTDPVKVGTFYDLPDCYTYTGSDFGRACVPTAPASSSSIFRATNYPSGVALSATDIVVTYGSYINKDSNPTKGNCSPNGISADTFLNLYTGVGDTNGCNNDIIRSQSNNGGASFTGTNKQVRNMATVSKELGSTLSDQWWQWTALTPTGKAVSAYYDRGYGADMATGFMDLTLAYGNSYARITDFSLPPSNEFPDATGNSVFMGDYIGIAVGADGVAHPAWVDTRNGIYTFDDTPGADPRILTFYGYDQDIYTRAMPLSS